MNELGLPIASTPDLLLSRDPTHILQARAGKSDQSDTALQAAKDFESVLLSELLREMKKTIPNSGLLETGMSEQVGDLFWMYLARDLGSKGGLGLWKEIYRQMGGAQSAQVDPVVEQSL